MAAAYTTDIEPPSVRALQQCHPELRQYLNFATLLPYLSKYGLITKEQQEELIELPIYTTAQKADKLLMWLPRSRPDFLERFIQSLRETSEGTNHEELATSLEEALEEAENDENGSVVLKDYIVRDTALLIQTQPPGNLGRRPTLIYRTTMVLTCRQNVRKYYRWLLCYGTLLTVLLSMVTTLSVLSRFPSPTEMVEPRDVARDNTIELHFGPYDTWIVEATMLISRCTASIMVIPDLSCKKLSSMYTYNYTTETTAAQSFYLLPGSVIHFNISRDTDMAVWIFTDLGSQNDAYISPELYDCDDPPSSAFCFKTSEHPGAYDHRITKASFYFLKIEHGRGLSWYIDVLAYNYTKLVSVYTPLVVLYDDSPETIQLRDENYMFNPVCVIMHLEDYVCPTNQGTLIVTHIKRRQDVLLFPGLLLLIVTLSSVVTVIVHCVHVWRRSARRQQRHCTRH